MTTDSPEPKTLDEIAAGAAALIAEARAAGLAAPFSLRVHDYGPPTAALYLYAADHGTPGIWIALQKWADHYGTGIDTHPGVDPASIHACARFTRDGISYEISSIIRADGEPAPQDQPA